MPITSQSGHKIKVLTSRAGKKRSQTITVDATPTGKTRRTLEDVGLSLANPALLCGSINTALGGHEEQSQTSSSYRDNKGDEIDAWQAIEHDLIKIMLDLEVPTNTCCSTCGIDVQNPIRCMDCSPFVVFCKGCEVKSHDKMFHKPEIWEGNIYRPYTGDITVLRRPDHKCITETSRNIVIVDDQGRLHNAFGVFCECEPHPCTLVRYGFWASTPLNPGVGFSIVLLNTLHMLTLECAVSVKGFVQMLRWKNAWTEIEFIRIYQILIGECISSYRNFKRSLKQEYLRHCDTSTVSEVIKCPACPKNCGVTTVSIDGNFGLVRKRNSGVSQKGPTHSRSFFMKDDEVEAFVNKYQNDNHTDQECSTFKAGDAVRSHARNAKLDVRGVFGSVCRHEFPVTFMDMKHAERLAYPVCLIKHLQEKLGNTRLQVVYDIACVLSRHLQRTQQFEILNSISLGLPIFHSYGHGATCQIQYSIRNLEGFGLTDGEGTERLWSYLRPLSKVTKEMTPTHRKELLNDALDHFCRRKITGLAKWLEMRAVRARDVHKEATANLNELLTLLSVTRVQVQSWASDQKKQFLATTRNAKAHLSPTAPLPLSQKPSIQTHHSPIPPNNQMLHVSGIYFSQDFVLYDHRLATSWETSYVQKLQQYYNNRAQMQAGMNIESATYARQQLAGLEESLCKIEKSHAVMARWTTVHLSYIEIAHVIAAASKDKILRQLHQDSSSRAFLVQLLSKYCDGQTVAIRLSKQVQKATAAVKKCVVIYNGIIGVIENKSHLPESINERDALIPTSSIFDGVSAHAQIGSGGVPIFQRWKAVEHLTMCDRASEEIEQIHYDIRSTLHHYTSLHKILSQAAHSLSATSEKVLLITTINDTELIMKAVWQVAHKYLDEVELLPSFSDVDGLVEVEIAATDTVIDSDCDFDSDDDWP